MKPAEIVFYIMMFVFLPITAIALTLYVLIKYPSMCRKSRYERENNEADKAKGGSNER